MRNILLMILLAVASNSALAEWIKVGNNETDTLYADPTSIIKSAYKVKMRTLYDYKKAIVIAGGKFLSASLQVEYDCKKNLSRTLFFAFYHKNMGKGNEAYTDPEPHEWEPSMHGSARETLLKFACNGK